MQSFKIEGGHKLKGEIFPQGAKNEALQIICAVLLTDKKISINNIPNIIAKRIDVTASTIVTGNVSDNMIKWKTKGTELYQQLPEECKDLMIECKPLPEIEKDRKSKQKGALKTWKKTK